MKLKGEFILRQVGDDIVAIPVGAAARRLPGMILLNPVSRQIWVCLEQDTTPEQICSAVTARFTVSEQEARRDIEEFLEHMRSSDLLEE